jgi:hypothetical protein
MLAMVLIFGLTLAPMAQRDQTPPPGPAGTPGLTLGDHPAPPLPLPKPMQDLPPMDPPMDETSGDVKDKGKEPPKPKRKQDCLFAWNYEPNPQLASFRIFVSTTSGAYRDDQPVAEIPAIPSLVTQEACAEVSLPKPNTYYAIARAVDLEDHMSDPSNEICFKVEIVGGPFVPCDGQEEVM